MKEIHYLIWNSCNLNCGFCFWDKRMGDILLDDKKKIVDEIVKTGIRKITLSWWEPLSSGNFLEILEYMFKNNLEIILHSNWLLINKNNAPNIAKYISRLSLTLDWVSSETQIKMRWVSNITEHTLNLIKLFNELKIPVNVKSLVTKMNLNEIEKIWEILNAEKISYWSLLEFIPLNRGKINQETYSLNDWEFTEITKKIKEKFPELNLRVRSFASSGDKYCLISADWKVYTNLSWKDILVWDIFTDNLSNILSEIK